MSLPGRLQYHLSGLVAVAAAAVIAGATGFKALGYAPASTKMVDDSVRPTPAELASHERETRVGVGAVIPGYLSSRGLPPVPGQLSITDTALLFRSSTGSVMAFPLAGPVRKTAGRQWRESAVSLGYVDRRNGIPVYLIRVDAGVFETESPGALLDLAAHPSWLDSLTYEGPAHRSLVGAGDSTASWTTAREIAGSSYADSLYALFGRPSAPVGLIGRRGRQAGRLGEYVASRDSLAIDPARMVGEAQLRHAVAHELGHRWQARAPSQLNLLWRGIPPIRDPKRYGYHDVREHQAEAIAFAVNFLQTTAAAGQGTAGSLILLDHYELLVPGTRALARYFSLQPIYRNHPLRSVLSAGTVEPTP